MITCSHCQHQNAQDAISCINCGYPLSDLRAGMKLCDRYKILKLLGQGGFGKTYLVEDTNKFNETLVIKELLPGIYGTKAISKAEELFQRGAKILHRLDHPQIPKFREIFKDGKRLFLAENFVEGETYFNQLQERLSAGQTFSETEVLQLFRQLLPVLSYLHSQNVIHRDISPDNIIYRTADGLPVLIDFGGVKQIALDVKTELQEADNLGNHHSPTCLGKIGYCPDEQMSRGYVAPHSDLYALAATALSLMTGNPQPTVQLRDLRTEEWKWPNQLNLSPGFSQLLQKMLAQNPQDRFQSAAEVLQFINGANDTELLAETLLRDRYLIKKVLGRGGFGTIYLAEDIDKFNEQVVLKEFTPTGQGTYGLQKAQEHFEREAKSLNQLKHHQIPKFDGFFRYNKRLFLVQEFVHGTTLHELVEQGKRFNEAEIIQLFKQILPVLAYIHQQGVIHRDISPENIMQREADGLPVLIDFGTVKEVAIKVAHELSGNSSSSGTIIGKKGYAPDEQMGKGIVAPHSDLYALAATSLYLLTGKSPIDFWDSHQGEWLWKQQVKLSPKLTQAIDKMLAKSPAKRFQTVEELQKLLFGGKLLNRSDSETIEKIAPKYPQHKWLIGGISAAVLAGAIALLTRVLPGVLSASNIGSFGGDRQLTIGVVNASWLRGQDEAKYTQLAAHLKSELSQQLKRDIIVNLEKLDSREQKTTTEVIKQLQDQNWDIVFTLLPMLSVEAEQNDYIFVARMFPDIENIRSVFLVRSDSSIQSIKDLNNKKIALGSYDSVPLFYMPLYYLYGLTMELERDKSPKEIIDKITSGSVDVGVAMDLTWERATKNNPTLSQTLRAIALDDAGNFSSRPIPMAGVYLSPKLTHSEQKLLEQMISNTPVEMRSTTSSEGKSNLLYTAADRIDYEDFTKITEKVNQIWGCAKLDQEKVQFYCYNLKGSVASYSRNGTDYILDILEVTSKDRVYKVRISEKVLKRVSSPAAIKNKNLIIQGLKEQEIKEYQEILITDENQIQIE
jgi:serine/threonine-protein kinase